MNKTDLRILSGFIYFYVTLVIMNSVKFIGIISQIGSVGKLACAVGFIGFMIFFKSQKKFKLHFIIKNEWFIFITTILIFAAYYILTTRSRIQLLPNLAFSIYFVAYYYIIFFMLQIFLSQTSNLNSALLELKFFFLKVYRNVLVLNMLIWFPVAIVGGGNLWDVEGGFGGFYEDEIHFGLYAVTGFLTTFYLRYKIGKKDRSFSNAFLMLVFAFIAFFTSRNALLIIIVATVYYFFLSTLKNRFYRICLTWIMLIGGAIGLLLKNISETEIMDITSGRYYIWGLTIEKMFSESLLFRGYGLFNLNDIILAMNKGTGSYYLDSLITLSLHNSYLEIVAAGGIVALVFGIKMIYKVSKYLSSIEKSIVLAILFGAFFESYLVQPFKLISFLFFFIIISNSLLVKIKKFKKGMNIKEMYHSKDLVQI